MTQSKELVGAGRLGEALELLQGAVRAAPGDVATRLSLVEVLCLLGRWERAAVHAEAAGEMSPAHYMKTLLVLSLIRGEREREESWAGRRKPSLACEPEAWSAAWLDAFQQDCVSPGGGDALRADALALVPVTEWSQDGTAIGSLRDLHGRLGPVLETFVNGGYLWTPFAAIQCLMVEVPRTHLDLIWCRAAITLVGGAQIPVHLPCRYAGTTPTDVAELMLSRLTRWNESDAGSYPVGARVIGGLANTDFTLLELGGSELCNASAPVAVAVASIA